MAVLLLEVKLGFYLNHTISSHHTYPGKSYIKKQGPPPISLVRATKIFSMGKTSKNGPDHLGHCVPHEIES